LRFFCNRSPEAVRFGISTHLYHDQRLARPHLEAIAAHGFDRIELFATRTHFDYHQPAAIDELAGWLADTGLTLHSIHAPIVKSLVGDTWGQAFTNAASNEAVRQRAVEEVAAAVKIAEKIETGFLIVHLGTPREQASAPGDNDVAAARRSLEEIATLAGAVSLRVAAEVIPNALSDPGALVALLEDEERGRPVGGVCLDFGHAFLLGDVIDAIEVTSGHLLTTHVHDNHGKVDEHLAPFLGAIDWPAALMTLQKVGYDGTLLFEVRNTGDAGQVLAAAVDARRRFEEILG
jgi:sugar phosphate isomerase/epimerase